MGYFDVENLSISFGGLKAVDDMSLSVNKNEIFSIIGPNGSGKTTIFNLISGIYHPNTGSVKLEEENLVGKTPDSIAKKGIARTFQNIRLFQNLTVLDNVRIAYHPHAGYGIQDGLLRNGKFTARERELTEKARDFLAIFGLDRLQNEIAKNLPYGEQRRVEIARALASDPKLLLLDEPAAGMNPNEIGRLMEYIHFIRDRFNLTILLIEHQMRLVMNICEKLTVMDFGQIIARGGPKDIQDNPRVIEACL